MLKLFENHFDTRSHVRSRNDEWTNEEEEEEEERTEIADDAEDDMREEALDEERRECDDLLVCGVYPNRESFA